MVDVSKLRVIERLPCLHGRYFHSENMTVAHYDSVEALTDGRAIIIDYPVRREFE